jgi:hypothetical protein
VLQLDGQHLVLLSARKVVQGVPAKEITGTLKGKAVWKSGGKAMKCEVDATYRIDLNRPLSPTIQAQECAQLLLKKFFLLE